MANLPESSTWETGITQIEKGEILSGGSTGVANRALKQLVNRTKYLYYLNVDNTATSISFTNIPSACELMMVLHNIYDNSITFPSSFSFGEESYPSVYDNLILECSTIDSGTEWMCHVVFNEDTDEAGYGPLWGMGKNSAGEVGLIDKIDRSSPVQIGSSNNWSNIITGTSHSLAITSNNTIWSWGQGNYGVLGHNVFASKSSPTQIGVLTNWSNIGAGDYHSLAIKTDGTLWTWGYNAEGQLGDGTTTHKSSPTQIGGLTNWSSIDGGYYYSMAIKTDGTLWGWGQTQYRGEIGDGTNIDKSSPVQIGNLTDWAKISCSSNHSLAIKTDGTLWTWGCNTYGELGLNDLIHRSSPVQIGSLTDWSEIASASPFSLAIKTDGTLWGWGRNLSGQLGKGDTTLRSSPVQIGSLTDWSKFPKKIVRITVFAIKTDGTLWGWGNNTYGILTGETTTTSKSSPIQIGSLTDWCSVSVGDQHMIALK